MKNLMFWFLVVKEIQIKKCIKNLIKPKKKMSMTKKAIFWIREDFRIENNPALIFCKSKS
jgi:hypothetical protein